MTKREDAVAVKARVATVGFDIGDVRPRPGGTRSGRLRGVVRLCARRARDQGPPTGGLVVDRTGWVALAGPPGPCAEKMPAPWRPHLSGANGLASAAIQAALAFLDAQPRSNGEPAG